MTEPPPAEATQGKESNHGEGRSIARDVVLLLMLLVQLVTVIMVAHLYWSQIIAPNVGAVIPTLIMPDDRAPGPPSAQAPPPERVQTQEPAAVHPLTRIFDSVKRDTFSPIRVDYTGTTVTRAGNPSWRFEWQANLSNRSTETHRYDLRIRWVDGAGNVVDEIVKSGAELRIAGGEKQTLKGVHYIPSERAAVVRKINAHVTPVS